MQDKTAAVVLAAGQGKRMRSATPKVLHLCAEVPLIHHAVKRALECGAAPVVVVLGGDGRGAPVQASLEAAFPDAPLVFAVQQEPLGTGDAVRAGLAAIPSFEGRVWVLYGDVPLLRFETLEAMAARSVDAVGSEHCPLVFLTTCVADPTGYGRVVRRGAAGEATAEDGEAWPCDEASGAATSIVEHKDASPAELAIREINAGVYLCQASFLRDCLSQLGRSNAQGEFYLTDIVAMADSCGGARTVVTQDPGEVQGVNNRAELVAAERVLCERTIARWQAAGVIVRDVAGSYIGPEVELAADVTLGYGVQLYGRCVVGPGAVIEGPSVLVDATVGSGARVLSMSHLESARVCEDAQVGPFARLRPGAIVGRDARVGNFVEIKNATLHDGAKAGHLAYLGDAEVGAGSNIGAGTITCNYDGANKHKTTLGEGVFVGSNSTLVAPVHLDDGVYVAAGSTITADAPADALVFGRAKQATRDGYGARLRARLKKRQDTNE